jgi:AAA+ ATPase superfamily predicted ATPase
VVLDEFPYLCEGNNGVPSIVQKIWDDIREQRIPMILVLCGSRISFMERLLTERNPLHGRQSAEFAIQPLTYRETAAFVPRWSVEDRLRLFGVFGAMPYYLSLLDPTVPLAANIHRLLLDAATSLYGIFPRHC